MWYLYYQNEKIYLCVLNSFKGFHLSIKKAIMWYPDNQLFHPLQESNKNTK